MKNKRVNKAFRFLAILLLALELLAPTLLESKSEGKKNPEQQNASLIIGRHQTSLPFLPYEETSNESKEEDVCLRTIELCFTELFNGIQNLRDIETLGKSPQEKYDTHPPLNLKHRVFQI